MTGWTTVHPAEGEAICRLYEEHFVRYELNKGQRVRYRRGLQMLLAWLRPAPSEFWQEVWEARVEAKGAWKDLIAPLTHSGRTCLYKAVQVLVAHRVVRPSYGWLLDHGPGAVYYLLFDTTEREVRDRIASAARESATALIPWMASGSCSAVSWRILARRSTTSARLTC